MREEGNVNVKVKERWKWKQGAGGIKMKVNQSVGKIRVKRR